MALLAGETWQIKAGFVTDLNGNLRVTTSLTGATWQSGFLRDPDGRLVVKYA